ncbi:MAG: pyridoxamine 5'-phosphate oxidase family protein [Tissierellia bacterium]|nr:pyridoxamine 5'-phosphate oxidase family protein [Tissierellia bacterium]
MNDRMTVEELKEKIWEFLKEHKEGSLATCLNNVPRSSPVQYVVGDNLRLYIVSAGGEKFKAIHQNPNVCLLVNTNYINYRQIKGVQIFGKATTSIDNQELFDEAKRYHPDPYQLEHEQRELKIIKIEPEEIVYLDSLGDGDRTKQILNLRENRLILKEDERLIYR